MADQRKPLPPGFLTEPVPNERAIAWIQGKTPLSAEVFKGLLPELKARAIAVSGVTSASLARDIREAIAAVPAGADWDKQRRQIADLINPFVASGDDKAAKKARTKRAELLLRTHGFQGYAVAQHEAMKAQKDVFPYWQYLSMEDERVRQSHAKLNKLIFPADSPFWHRHTPPWDWGCRCRKVSLLPDEVAEIQAREAKLAPERKTVIEGPALELVEKQNKLNRGITEVYDITAPADRGKPGAFLFEPDSLRLSVGELEKRYDAATWADFRVWSNKTEVEPGTTVWQWMGGAKLKGAAKAPVPVVVPPTAAATTTRTLTGITQAMDGHVGEWSALVAQRGALWAEYNAALARSDHSAMIAKASEHAANEVEIGRLLDKARAAIEIPVAERGKVIMTGLMPSTQKVAEAGARLTERYTHKDLLPVLGVRATRKKRAYHQGGTIYINSKTSTSTAMHEITHGTEQQTAAVLAESLGFLKKRAGNEPLKSLRKLTGNSGYKADEFAWEDEFAKRGGSHYAGKTYGSRATELLTMGVERLHADPVEFFASDREYFEFVVRTLQKL